MMYRKTLEELRVLLAEVDELVTEVIIDLDMKNERDQWGNKRDSPFKPHPGDNMSGGNKNTGALRRRSMDLTRKLAEMRKPE